jgi:hypothetical protein
MSKKLTVILVILGGLSLTGLPSLAAALVWAIILGGT